MTEEEAVGKWCPFARIVVTNEGGVGFVGQSAYNRKSPANTHQTVLPSAGLCIGSQCMAWRPNISVNAVEASYGREPNHGYCGLAGEALAR